MASYTLDQLYPLLQTVQKPGRYTGGEFGSISKKKKDSLKIALCFPDLYEIGMSNQAVKILYNLLNSLDGIECERVYAPLQDFEQALKKHRMKLYSLESFTPINDFDLLAFSIGYELSFTNILTVLESSGIPLKNIDRSHNDPVVIAGGPALTNPLPFGEYIDFIYMGEAEETLKQWVMKLKDVKKEGKGRKGYLDVFQQSLPFWYQGKQEKTNLVRWSDFGQVGSFGSGTPVPTIGVVQDNGVVEIMRGCPNKCRFCHAGVFYRPKREKKWAIIVEEIDHLVFHCGYRSITLSSLSTGDFTDIDKLVVYLNERYSSYGVSFNLPSLRVNSISLKLLNLVSVVRKSGLTFAVEAPTEEAQRGLNKDVSTERIIAILHEARNQGWKLAKFYFMLGLPVSPEDEELKIIEYLNHIQHQTRMQLNVNIGTFIPKTFTPFASSKQLQEEISLEKIKYIKRNINNKRIRISFHSPFASFLEGIFARGDERAGTLALKAFQQGARLDAWEEHLDRDQWKQWIAEDGFWEDYICHKNDIQTRLNTMIGLGISSKKDKEETKRAETSHFTPPCEEDCPETCGVCGNKLNVINADQELPELPEIEKPQLINWEQLLFSYSKSGRAVFMGHLDVMHQFEGSFLRAGLNVVMSQGYNPKPKIEFANPLSLGLETQSDYFSARIYGDQSTIEKGLDKLNQFLPEGLSIVDFSFLENKGKLKLMQLYRSAEWEITHLKDKDTRLLTEFISRKEFSSFYKLEVFPDKIQLHIEMKQCPYNNPLKLLREVLQDEFPLARGIRVKRLTMNGIKKKVQ